MNGAGLGSGGGGGRKSSGGGVGGSGSNPGSAGMNRFREFMNWVFAPDASLLSSRQGSMTEQGRTPTSALTPLFASDFNFSIIPESVRSVTRHLLTKQFAHIWTPRADSDEKLDKPATPSLAAGGGLHPCLAAEVPEAARSEFEHGIRGNAGPVAEVFGPGARRPPVVHEPVHKSGEEGKGVKGVVFAFVHYLQGGPCEPTNNNNPPATPFCFCFIPTALILILIAPLEPSGLRSREGDGRRSSP